MIPSFNSTGYFDVPVLSLHPANKKPPTDASRLQLPVGGALGGNPVSLKQLIGSSRIMMNNLCK
jgi:hypothetical protein